MCLLFPAAYNSRDTVNDSTLTSLTTEILPHFPLSIINRANYSCFVVVSPHKGTNTPF